MEVTNKILLIHKILSGQASKDENSTLEKMLNDEANDKELYNHIKVLWDSSSEIKKDPVSFSKTELKADIFNIIGEPTVKKQNNFDNKFKTVLFYRVLAAAAAVAVLFSIAAVLYNSLSNITINANNELVYSELPDNSKVWISNNSSIKYSRSFSFNERQIFLKGSAYFNVSHDKNNPFIVEILDNVIKVVGTSFQISNYDDKKIEVSVYSGVVEFYRANGEFVTLKQGDRAVYNYNDQKFVINTTGQISSNLRSEYLTFQNADLGMVFEKLSNYFECQIDVKCDFISEMKGYTSPGFAGDNIEYYLNTIKKLYKIDIVEISEKRFEVICL